MVLAVLRGLSCRLRRLRFNPMWARRAAQAQCCLALSLLSSQSMAQTVQVQKDPAAIAAIKLALKSMGGQPTITGVSDATFIGQYQGSATSASDSGQVTWKSIGVSVRCDTSSVTGGSTFTKQNGSGFVESTSGNVTPMEHSKHRSYSDAGANGQCGIDVRHAAGLVYRHESWPADSRHLLSTQHHESCS